ncbi:MAG: B12-binding domain-containing radical SAM protein [Chlamydiota bacterium]
MKILLLHPPGVRDYNRGYYCSATTKSAYLFPPLDLLFVSGIVRDAGCEVVLIDAIADRLDPGRAIALAAAAAPSLVIGLSGIVSWEEDRRFFARLKARIPAPIVVSGDVFLDAPADLMRREPWIDGVLFDFTSPDIVRFLGGEREGIGTMVVRRGGGIADCRGAAKRGVFTLPVPMHELFIGKRYRHPFTRSRPLASVLTSFGCPGRCFFCVADAIPFRHRPAADVAAELDCLRSLGVREILFADFTFGVPRDDRRELLRIMIERGYGFDWSCFSRVDVVDEEMLALFTRAGCHTIIFGVESGDDEVLAKYRKGFDTGRVRRVFRLCRTLGIDTVATFIIAGPYDTLETCERTIRFARELPCDYASFNVAVPRPCTQYRREAVARGIISEADLDFDHSGGFVTRGSGLLSAAEIRRLRRRAVRSFYLRPCYILGRLCRVRSWHQLRELVANGVDLVLKAAGMRAV